MRRVLVAQCIGDPKKRATKLTAAGLLLLGAIGCASSSIGSPVFHAEAWKTLMVGARLAMCVMTAVLVVLAALLVPKRGRWNVACGIAASAIALIAFLSYLHDVYFVDDRYALMGLPLYLAGLATLCAYSWSARYGFKGPRSTVSHSSSSTM